MLTISTLACGATTDREVTLTPVLRNRGEGGVGYFNWATTKTTSWTAWAPHPVKSSTPAKREQLIKAALREHAQQVHHIPLHRQVIPWPMRSNVTAVQPGGELA